jgi:amino acid transporter
VLALVVVHAFVLADRDPVVDLFTWLSGVSAVGVVLLMTLTSAAVVGFFRHRPEDGVSAWQRRIAPTLATVLLSAVLLVLVVNFDALLAPGNPGYLAWLLPGVTVIAALLGLGWGLVLRAIRPDVYAAVGRGVTEPAATEETELTLTR